MEATATQADQKPLLIEIEGGEVFTDKHPLNELFNCVKFWNKNGLHCHINNNEHYKTGGSYEDFILRCMAADCRAFVDAKPSTYQPDLIPGQFITGKGGSHVWVKRVSNDERILFIHF